MSYQPPPPPPPPSPEGEKPTEGGNTSPSQGYTPRPPGGGYSPSPPAGGYGPPPSPPGGYPPHSSGYLQRPTGFIPPPVPPVPVQESPTKAAASDFEPVELLQSYSYAVMRPNPAIYEIEIENASWVKTLTGISIAAIVATIMGLMTLGVTNQQYDQSIQQLMAQGQGAETVVPMIEFFRTLTYWATLGSLVSTFITFFLGTTVQYVAARIFSGEGFGSGGTSFEVQAYLSSLSYAPLHSIASIVNVIPAVGPFISLALNVYQIVCVGLSLQASQRMETGKAMLAAFSPLFAVVLLICGLCAGSCALGFLAAGSVSQ